MNKDLKCPSCDYTVPNDGAHPIILDEHAGAHPACICTGDRVCLHHQIANKKCIDSECALKNGPIHQKIHDGIAFTLEKYGKTFKDLAEYDKQE